MTWTKPTDDSNRRDAITTLLPGGVDLAIGHHAGVASIASPVEGMIHAHPDLHAKFRRSGAWHNLGRQAIPVFQGAISATLTRFVAPVPQGLAVVEVGVVSDTGTTSDGSNLWTLDLQNLDTAQSLFSSPPTTNGDELVANAPWAKAVDQNVTVSANQVLQASLTATGSPTALANALIYVVVDPRFD